MRNSAAAGGLRIASDVKVNPKNGAEGGVTLAHQKGGHGDEKGKGRKKNGAEGREEMGRGGKATRQRQAAPGAGQAKTGHPGPASNEPGNRQ